MKGRWSRSRGLSAGPTCPKKPRPLGGEPHLTETCDPDDLHVITHVETTEATTTDVMMTETIHQALVDKHLAPDQHLVDGGYVDAELLVESRHAFDLELVGPVRGDISWQSRDEHAYDLSHFEIHWDSKQVTCPLGHLSSSWGQSQDHGGKEVIHVKFSNKACDPCPSRSRCTKAKSGPHHRGMFGIRVIFPRTEERLKRSHFWTTSAMTGFYVHSV